VTRRENECIWEEIQTRSAQFTGRRVRITVLDDESIRAQPEGNALLRYAGKWDGDDLEECLCKRP
jgi:hypothetical protein